MHLFFACPFAKAAWVAHPWFIKSEILCNNYNSIAQIIHALLNSGHPQASLINIMTFLWCIWKARNDALFDRKEVKPMNVFQAMQAILNNQELALQSNQAGQATCQNELNNNLLLNSQQKGHAGTMQVIGPSCRVFTDAAWKPGRENVTGIGISIQLAKEHQHVNISILVSEEPILSPLQAEAMALQVAAQVVIAITTGNIMFFTDNQVLAQAAQARNILKSLGHWEIRNQLANFFATTSHTQIAVHHIPRKLNGRAHNNATKAYSLECNTSPVMTCNSRSHLVEHCPMLLKLGNLNISKCKAMYVTCSSD